MEAKTAVKMLYANPISRQLYPVLVSGDKGIVSRPGKVLRYEEPASRCLSPLTRGTSSGRAAVYWRMSSTCAGKLQTWH